MSLILIMKFNSKVVCTVSDMYTFVDMCRQKSTNVDNCLQY